MSLPTMNPHEVADWDLGALRAGSARFTEVADSCRSWVLRVEAVGRSLSDPGAWDGPASDAGLADLATWLAVAARVGPQLQTLAAGIADVVSWYQQAQEASATALRLAATTGVTVSTAGEVAPSPQVDTTGMAPEQAVEVLARAAAAAAVAAELERARQAKARGDALISSDAGVFRALGLPGFDLGSGFVDLMSAVHVPTESLLLLLSMPGGAAAQATIELPPAGAAPDQVAIWWVGLALDQQLRLIEEYPELIGGLDGVSAWARDLANRRLMQDILDQQKPGDADYDFALAVSLALDQAGQDGRPAQLYLFDPVGQLAAVSVGDIDTADNVALLVPGTGVDVTGDLLAQVGKAETLWTQTQSVDPDASVAVLAWMGYDTPNVGEAVYPTNALVGAPALAGAVAGIAARPGTPPRTTVIAHSYGTVTTAAAVSRPGQFAADAVVVVGSPGMDPTARDFEVPEEEVYVGEASDDWIADTWAHGPDPGVTWLFGGTCIEADPADPAERDHFHYFDADSPALLNMALIVQGQRRDLVGCDD